jgi:hypothetical protein
MKLSVASVGKLGLVRCTSLLLKLPPSVRPRVVQRYVDGLAERYGAADAKSLLDAAGSLLEYEVFGRRPLCRDVAELCLNREWFDEPAADAPLGQSRWRREHTHPVVVVDDFYEDPMAVRRHALACRYHRYGRNWFCTVGNGQVTDGAYRLVTPEIMESIEVAAATRLRPLSEQKNSWNGAFHYKVEEPMPPSCSVHSHQPSDIEFGWNGIVYLNPPGAYPRGSGVTIWRHRGTGKCVTARKIYDNDLNHFDLVAEIENVFNRLVLLRSDVFHRGERGFGRTPETARLFQTFFVERVPPGASPAR